MSSDVGKSCVCIKTANIFSRCHQNECVLYTFFFCLLLLFLVSFGKYFIPSGSIPGPLKSECATQATASFIKIQNGFGLVVCFDFIFATSSSGSRSLSSAKPRRSLFPSFSEALASTRSRQKTRHKQKLILATGMAAVSNAFSCAGLGRL